MAEVKSCPFCGEEPAIVTTVFISTGKADTTIIECINESCNVQPQTIEMFSREDAESAWNGRAE